MASVQIRGIQKYFGSTQIIRGVDIDIDDGQFAVLVGPSGCGKSTLLRMLAGLEEITHGEVLIGGRVVNNIPPKERDIAMVFQNYALYPHMTVYDNMAFALHLARQDKATIAAKVARAAEILALGALLERYPRQLSGGQRQRVAMGRAIVRDPQVFLFHEPLSNLDAKLRVAMRSEIKELHQRLKTGSPLDLYDHPANQFVAGFIGSPAMNFLPATLRRSASGVQVELRDGTRLDAAPNSGGVDGQPVIFGTRPEHMTLASTGGIAARVVVMEPTGMDTFIDCRHEDVGFAAVFRERHDFAPGSIIHLLPDLQRSHLFDAQTGQRLAA